MAGGIGEGNNMTLLDRVDSFMHEYVFRSPSEKKANIPIDKAEDYGTESKKWKADSRLTPKRRRELALLAPFFMKACKKKNLDRFRAWFEFEHVSTHKPPSVADFKIFKIFNDRADPKIKFVIASICADIYGDGFILKKYIDDYENKDGTIDYELPPKPSARPVNLELMNPENLTEMRYLSEKNAKKGKQFKNLGIQHYYYHNSKTGKEIFIHPDRIMHYKDDQLPFSKLGISKVDMLRNIIESEADIDIATGEILKWFSHGILEVTKVGMQPNERKEVLKTMANHPNYYAYDDRYKLQVHNPTAIDPKEFYNYIVLAIASVFVMPTQVLLGVQIGKVTGAETGYGDYYRDVKDKQELLDTPMVKQLYGELLKSYGREFNYEPMWNDIFVGELAESELIGKRAATVQILIQSGVIDAAEGREMMNKGKIYLDPNKKIKPMLRNDTDNNKEKQNPIVRKPLKDKDKKPKKESVDIFQLRQAMIEKRKSLLQAEIEKKLGNQIIEEQDDLFGKEKQ